jgi:hypothetical protein
MEAMQRQIEADPAAHQKALEKKRSGSEVQ